MLGKREKKKEKDGEKITRDEWMNECRFL